MGGIINKILYALTFENYDYVFKNYVNFFTDLRKKSKEYDIFGKLMINSIYGRLGMSDIRTHSFIEKKEKLKEIVKIIDIIEYKEINNIILIEAVLNNKLEKYLKIKNNKTKNNIVIASAITSKARIKLYKAQQAVLENKGRLLYSDTDSVFAAYKEDVSNQKHGEIF
jgi:DNA polymerase elongation subunit (family B)